MRRIYLAAVAISITGLLAGCAGGDNFQTANLSLSKADISRYSSTHALLDPSTGNIALPLDAYAMTWQQTQLIASANDVLIDRCLRKSGLANPLVKLDRSSTSAGQDRTFGIWVEQLAAQYGYQLPPDDVAIKGNALLAAQTPAWGAAQMKCYNTTKTLQTLTYTDSQAQLTSSAMAIGVRGRQEAHLFASQQPEWKTERTAWWGCLRSQGVTPRTGEDNWTPQIPADQQGAIKTALIDVGCKAKTNFIQRISDLESEYEAAYINKNQAALNSQLAIVKKVVAQAKILLGTNS